MWRSTLAMTSEGRGNHHQVQLLRTCIKRLRHFSSSHRRRTYVTCIHATHIRLSGSNGLKAINTVRALAGHDLNRFIRQPAS